MQLVTSPEDRTALVALGVIAPLAEMMLSSHEGEATVALSLLWAITNESTFGQEQVLPQAQPQARP